MAVWECGFAMPGGLIAGPLIGVLLAWRLRLPILRSLDVIAPRNVLGQTLGRWGDFFNEEGVGRPTALPWKLYISPAHRPPEFRNQEFFHPTFLYESLWDLLVFAVLVWWVRPRVRRHPGAIFFSYIGLYSVGRYFIESLRLDSFWVGSLRVPQLASVAGVLVAVAGLLWVLRRPPGGPGETHHTAAAAATPR